MPIDKSLLLPLSEKGRFSTTSEEHYGKDYFLSGTTSGYAGYSSQAFPMMRDAILYQERYKIKKMKKEDEEWVEGTGDRVLDAGSATGILVDAFRKIGVEAYGIDISEWAIMNPDSPSVAPYIQVADVRDIPFSDDYFKLTLSLQTIEHIPETPVDLVKIGMDWTDLWGKYQWLDQPQIEGLLCEIDEHELAWLEMFRVTSKYIGLATPEQDTDNKERTHYVLRKVPEWDEYVKHLGGRRIHDCNLPLCTYTKIRGYFPAELEQNPELRENG